jgi:DNA-binding transcriptional regulator YiaG
MEIVMRADEQFILVAEQICYDFFKEAGCKLVNNQSIVGSSEEIRLIQLRKQLGLTQSEFAEEIGKSLRQVQYYEAGKIDVPKHVSKLMDALERQYIIEPYPAEMTEEDLAECEAAVAADLAQA